MYISFLSYFHILNYDFSIMAKCMRNDMNSIFTLNNKNSSK